jgi:hypothetical protein
LSYPFGRSTGEAANPYTSLEQARIELLLRVKSCDEEIIALETRSYDASGATSSPPHLSTGYDEQISSRRSV